MTSVETILVAPGSMAGMNMPLAMARLSDAAFENDFTWGDQLRGEVVQGREA